MRGGTAHGRRHTVLGSKALKIRPTLGFVSGDSTHQTSSEGDAPLLRALPENGAAEGDTLREGLVSLSAILFFHAPQGIDGQPGRRRKLSKARPAKRFPLRMALGLPNRRQDRKIAAQLRCFLQISFVVTRGADEPIPGEWSFRELPKASRREMDAVGAGADLLRAAVHKAACAIRGTQVLESRRIRAQARADPRLAQLDKARAAFERGLQSFLEHLFAEALHITDKIEGRQGEARQNREIGGQKRQRREVV